jgi:hypothetical protein
MYLIHAGSGGLAPDQWKVAALSHDNLIISRDQGPTDGKFFSE